MSFSYPWRAGLIACALCVFASQPSLAQTPTPDPAAVRAIAMEAYIYAFPMIENYNTMYKQLANPAGREYVGGFGRFRHYSEAYTPDNHDVVTPNRIHGPGSTCVPNHGS
ncbi:hypothetical protein WKW79_34140 [Variovorax robiniae]|uniref:Uncharacterized protein n=1 Tax=Variovorax robiniae TaxID=1836199 RepID=A0ABU8XKQ1_9BURK